MTTDEMRDNWLLNNTPTNCDATHNPTTLKRDFNGNVIGRRDTIKLAKKKLSYIKKHNKK